MAEEIFVANRTALIRHDGREIMLRRGITRVRAGHPLLKGREALFDAVSVDFEWPDKPVESATAAPGEKRSVAPRAKRRTKADDDG